MKNTSIPPIWAHCAPLTPCAVRDGGWSAYGDWGPCSRRCYWPGEEESGVRTRRRSCTNPTPDGGQECRGEEEEEEECALDQCGESLPPLSYMIWPSVYNIPEHAN